MGRVRIPRRGSTCSKGGESFSPGMLYFSVLHTEKEPWERRDYCAACAHQEPLKEGVVWQGKIPPYREESQAAEVDPAVLEAARTLPEGDPRLWLVVLYLERQGHVVRRTHQETEASLFYEYPPTGEGWHLPRYPQVLPSEEDLASLLPWLT